MEELNALGKRCPLPIIELAKRIATEPTGFEISLLSDDPATEPDLAAWARMTGNLARKTAENIFAIKKLAD